MRWWVVAGDCGDAGAMQRGRSRSGSRSQGAVCVGRGMQRAAAGAQAGREGVVGGKEWWKWEWEWEGAWEGEEKGSLPAAHGRG